MHWFIAKIVYQIVCGEGSHRPQFDEQLRLIQGENEEMALARAIQIGKAESEAFTNDRQNLVCWNYIDVSELYRLSPFMDGAEVYSRIEEPEHAGNYIAWTHGKAHQLSQGISRKVLNVQNIL